VTWAGSFWVAVGDGTNTIATSSNGMIWTGVSSVILRGRGVAWNSGV
jgi:hypothetical protein